MSNNLISKRAGHTSESLWSEPFPHLHQSIPERYLQWYLLQHAFHLHERRPISILEAYRRGTEKSSRKVKLKLTFPFPKSRSRSLIVTRTQFDDMSTSQLVLSIQFRIELCGFPKLRNQENEFGLAWGGGQGERRKGRAYADTKFVRRSWVSRVPPTICFTCPLWRSMQGRKTLRGMIQLDWSSLWIGGSKCKLACQSNKAV